jgi:hypothetical protein
MSCGGSGLTQSPPVLLIARPNELTDPVADNGIGHHFTMIVSEVHSFHDRSERKISDFVESFAEPIAIDRRDRAGRT